MEFAEQQHLSPPHHTHTHTHRHHHPPFSPFGIRWPAGAEVVSWCSVSPLEAQLIQPSSSLSYGCCWSKLSHELKRVTFLDWMNWLKLLKEAAVSRKALNFVQVFKWSKRTEGMAGFTGFVVELNEECHRLCVMQNLWICGTSCLLWAVADRQVEALVAMTRADWDRRPRLQFHMPFPCSSPSPGRDGYGLDRNILRDIPEWRRLF